MLLKNMMVVLILTLTYSYISTIDLVNFRYWAPLRFTLLGFSYNTLAMELCCLLSIFSFSHEGPKVLYALKYTSYLDY